VNEALAIDCLASARRREILRLVWHDERPAGEIHRALGDVTFGAVSQQLATLAAAGLLEVRRDGRRRLYRARRAALGPLGRWLERFWDDALYRLKLEVELDEGRRGPRPNDPRLRRRKGRRRASRRPGGRR
jgi:DNA-binding transcriptional ArsR family regulator